MCNLRLLAVLVLSAGMTATSAAADLAGGQAGSTATGSFAAPGGALRPPQGFGRAKPIELPAIDESQPEGTARAIVPAVAFTAVGRSRDDRNLSIPPSPDLLALVGGTVESPAAERGVPSASDD